MISISIKKYIFYVVFDKVLNFEVLLPIISRPLCPQLCSCVHQMLNDYSLVSDKESLYSASLTRRKQEELESLQQKYRVM